MTLMSESQTPPASAEEIENVIAELEQYRARLVNDVLQMAQKAKLSKKVALQHLEKHPEIAHIDAALERLKSQQAV